jgi:hypothetical protein
MNANCAATATTLTAPAGTPADQARAPGYPEAHPHKRYLTNQRG